MRVARALRGVVFACSLALILLAVTGTALAAGTKVCIPSKEGAAIVTAKAGACETGYTKSTLLPEAEQEKLEQILPYVTYVKEGIDKKPTIKVTEANVQIVSGSGSETKVNGAGNLVVGYDETPGTQTGSGNLLMGGTGNTFTGYGGILAGFSNVISGAYNSILGGASNSASGFANTLLGGYDNKVTSQYSTISGGCSNLAGTGAPAVTGACTNSADAGFFASIAGGAANQVTGKNASVTGGEKNLASAIDASVTGGYGSKSAGRWDSVSGGYENLATITEESNEFHGANSISGGAFGEASGPGQSWIGSGEYGKATGFHSSVVGGYKGTASGTNATVNGGAEGVSSGENSAVSGGSKNNAETTDSLAPNPEGVTVLTKAEQEALKPILKYMKFDGSGVGGKATVQIDGANLQVMSGGIPQRSGVEGTGNIVIGLNEEIEGRTGEWEGDPVEASKQTGSDNLIIGDEQHFSSYYSLIGGFQNTDSAPNSDVLGLKDVASGEDASVSGGYENTASSIQSAVSGGAHNVAKDFAASVSGGDENTAEQEKASVSGGAKNKASGLHSSISGGVDGTASGEDSSVSGGNTNDATGVFDSITGGAHNETKGEASSATGGRENRAFGPFSDVVGGSAELIEEEFGFGA